MLFVWHSWWHACDGKSDRLRLRCSFLQLVLSCNVELLPRTYGALSWLPDVDRLMLLGDTQSLCALVASNSSTPVQKLHGCIQRSCVCMHGVMCVSFVLVHPPVENT